MKLGPVTKLDKRNTTRLRNLTMTSFQQNLTSFSIFIFMANLQQLGSRTSEAWFEVLTFSLTVIFYLTKTESRTKNYLIQLTMLMKGTIIAKTCRFSQKKITDISIIMGVLVLKRIFSETTFMLVLTYQISSF